ncbi:receptor-like protein 2 [Salvia splendens]|uniref:receptor-like protein 2 n=1 Tax=Salvia splendens TaxID=180675 RepID=UPI001C26AF0C|nr:receptor-like protein 2 [Salvia splendens]
MISRIDEGNTSETNQMAKPMLLLTLSLNLILLTQNRVLSCDKQEQNSLLSFISSQSPPLNLNWSPSSNCCHWEGIACTPDGRVTRLWLSGKNLTAASLSLPNLPYLAHVNLSHNRLSGLLPSLPPRLITLDLSFNALTGPLNRTLPTTIHTLDLSSNRFNGSLDPTFLLLQPSGLAILNISNNAFTGPNPSSICNVSQSIKILDFSANQFTSPVSSSITQCSNLLVFRGGSNTLSGPLPRDLYTLTSLQEISLPNNQLSGPINDAIVNLSNLVILELHVNQLTGSIPQNIGMLSRLEQLQLHSNNLNGTFPPSLTKCTNLTTLLLRNNLLNGQISALDFSKLQRLQALDLGNNTFTGTIPDTLCLCMPLTAIRLAFNELSGEVPPCMASLKNLTHLSLSDNLLSNAAGALTTLKHCHNLAVLFLSRCFHDERVPDNDDLLHPDTFKNLQILTLGGCRLNGQIPFWISKLKKLKVLNLSFNKIHGPIPGWLGTMDSLYVLNLTQNSLTGEIPPEITQLPALISDNTSTDLSHLALPFLFDKLQYNRLFNLPRGVKLGNNSLTGIIPPGIGELRLLHILDLSNNNLSGSIPESVSKLMNLEKLDMSGNELSGEIPEALTKLHFLSAFSVADNDLEGEIPKGGQFETFGFAAFEGNPKLCGEVVNRSCGGIGFRPAAVEEEEGGGSFWCGVRIPFGVGYFVGLVAVSGVVFFKSWY